jgi:tripartite-type tricarboxylate transporter receptor subunit TctC
VALIALTLNTATAQQPVRMLYGFAAGGSGDLAARLLADVASKELGQRVVVENRTGANGMIAAEGAARGPTDGSNVLFCTTGNMTIVTELPGAQLPINPATDLIGIGQLLRSTFGLVVSKDSPYRSVQDLVADARANPGKVSFATPGVGSVQHLSTELLGQKIGAKMVHVPYRGLAGGAAGSARQPDELLDHQPRRRDQPHPLRTVAPAGTGRSARQALLPRCADDRRGGAGLRDLCLVRPVRSQGDAGCGRRALGKAIKAAVDDPTVSQKLLDNGMAPAFADSATLKKTMDENRRNYREVIRAANIKAE